MPADGRRDRRPWPRAGRRGRCSFVVARPATAVGAWCSHEGLIAASVIGITIAAAHSMHGVCRRRPIWHRLEGRWRCRCSAYEDPAAAIDWLERAFGFREQLDQRYTDEAATIGSRAARGREGLIMLASPTPDYQSPKHHREAVRGGRALVACAVGHRRRSGRDRRRRRALCPRRGRRARDCCRGSRTSRSGAFTARKTRGPPLDVHPARLTVGRV